MMSNALTLTAVGKKFGNQVVLKGLNLEVAPKELVAILGSSGSGKTTLLRLISGFESPDGGEVQIAGRIVAGDSGFVPAEQRRVGFVPQDAALFPHLSVSENIDFGLRDFAKSDRAARVAELLKLVDLVGFESRMPHELSGGQRHRVALARALAPNPDLILLDEPFSALDAELRGRLRDDVRHVDILPHDGHGLGVSANTAAVVKLGVCFAQPLGQDAGQPGRRLGRWCCPPHRRQSHP